MALAVIGASKPAKVRAIRDEIREAVHLHGWTEPATTEMRLLDSTLTSRTCLCHRNFASNNPPGYDNFVVPYLPDPPAEVLLSPLALGAPIKLPKLTRRSCSGICPNRTDLLLLLAHLLLTYDIRAFSSRSMLKGEWQPLFDVYDSEPSDGPLLAYRSISRR
ncbi:hypothetical protein SISSUDRAFT_1043070 [Sistotremastrum suecicum HHB10207 ss-3]|uniref:Uncharacterized protein n=1 Tax=Sistotremastrum suecicum HHB10207 ss-3 TaxID=1314776 RepID=A0A166G280_9AGAM|nr:hypothetical protein SISSUDRAFT_1043070 [Sistotremastrum suecicum HHB10207 ss-3]